MKPILFNTEMVRAILEGRKAVTRRVIKPQPELQGRFWVLGGAGWSDTINSLTPLPLHSLYNRMPYQPGDILYVRETWNADWCDHVIYKADGGSAKAAGYSEEPKWRPSIHMPKEAARIFLKVTRVRVERISNMNTNDYLREGICLLPKVYPNSISMVLAHAKKFKETWDSTIKKADLATYGWSANPWVWVIEFEMISKEEAGC